MEKLFLPYNHCGCTKRVFLLFESYYSNFISMCLLPWLQCCDGDCPPCEQQCNRTMGCRNHKCSSRCHRGQLSFFLTQVCIFLQVFLLWSLTLSCPDTGRPIVKICHSNLRSGSKELKILCSLSHYVLLYPDKWEFTVCRIFVVQCRQVIILRSLLRVNPHRSLYCRLLKILCQLCSDSGRILWADATSV